MKENVWRKSIRIHWYFLSIATRRHEHSYTVQVYDSSNQVYIICINYPIIFENIFKLSFI